MGLSGDLIRGKRVTLRLATTRDKRRIYKWLAQSDCTPSFMGPPDFPDHPVPTWEEFCQDYQSYYFDGSSPILGRCFIIMAGDRPVGQISYNEIDRQKRRTELDIWLGRESYCGQGYGPDALEALSKYLFETFGLVELVIRPSARNRRAVRAYAKAGFQRVEMPPERQEVEYGPGDYVDCILLIKRPL